jgi:hypothetical protein
VGKIVNILINYDIKSTIGNGTNIMNCCKYLLLPFNSVKDNLSLLTTELDKQSNQRVLVPINITFLIHLDYNYVFSSDSSTVEGFISQHNKCIIGKRNNIMSTKLGKVDRNIN